jgi:hypothetical protein
MRPGRRKQVPGRAARLFLVAGFALPVDPIAGLGASLPFLKRPNPAPPGSLCPFQGTQRTGVFLKQF